MLRISFTGKLGDDCRIIDTTKTPFIAFNVAEAGKDDPIWLDCTYSFDHGQLPKIAQYLKKGKSVYVEGKPYPKIYFDKEQKPQASQGVFVTYIELCGEKKEDGQPSPYYQK